MKRIYYYIFIIIFFISGCTLNNIKRVNVIKNITSIPPLISYKKQNVKFRELYKLRNGIIAVQYKKYYGYWYRVRRGDSLYRIARRSGISISLLRRANSLPRRYRLKYKSYLFIPIPLKVLRRRAELIQVPVINKEFIWPVAGRITSPFGLRRWGWRKKFHKGIDIGAPGGTKVMASKSGIVIVARREHGYGKIVIIKHNDILQTRYAHLQKILVHKGERVKQGEIIGLVGKTGRATGYHLHFEIRVLNTPVNPINYLPQEVNQLARIYYNERIKSLGLRQ